MSNALTVYYKNKSNTLTSKAGIGPPFDRQGQPMPLTEDLSAIWDTGATNSVISKNIVTKYKLQPMGMVEVNTAGGKVLSNIYLLSIYLPNKVCFPAVKVTEGSIAGADMLIGMDIIGSGDFVVTSYKNKTTFSYRIPSMAKIDFVKDINKLNEAKVGRNDPCPCGSGEKYKKCHGRGK